MIVARAIAKYWTEVVAVDRDGGQSAAEERHREKQERVPKGRPSSAAGGSEATNLGECSMRLRNVRHGSSSNSHSA